MSHRQMVYKHTQWLSTPNDDAGDDHDDDGPEMPNSQCVIAQKSHQYWMVNVGNKFKWLA